MAYHPDPSYDAMCDDPEFTAALTRKPDVEVPAGFAARVAREAAGGASPLRLPARSISWGRWAAYASLPCMLLLMLRFAALPADLGSAIVQGALCLQFLLVLLAVTQFRQMFGD